MIHLTEEDSMDLERVRRESLRQARELGYPINAGLPFLDPPTSVQSADRVVARALALHGVIAATFGFDRAKINGFMKENELHPLLTADERSFLKGGEVDLNAIQIRVEALWALSWALGLVRRLDHSEMCGDELASLYPRPEPTSDMTSIRSAPSLRSVDKLVSACDLAYCLHWAVVQASIEGAKIPGQVRMYVIAERRRALEWLLGTEEWDDVPMDT
jgi:hypothetical protein